MRRNLHTCPCRTSTGGQRGSATRFRTKCSLSNRKHRAVARLSNRPESVDVGGSANGRPSMVAGVDSRTATPKVDQQDIRADPSATTHPSARPRITHIMRGHPSELHSRCLCVGDKGLSGSSGCQARRRISSSGSLSSQCSSVVGGVVLVAVFSGCSSDFSAGGAAFVRA